MIIIGNGLLLARDKVNTFMNNAAVLVNGQKIEKIGTTEEIKNQFPDAEFIDANGALIMPGFINCHNHIYSAFARGLAIKNYNPSNFNDILEGLWWNLDSKLNLEMVKYSAYVVYMDCIKNGVTTVFDHHASYLDIEKSLFTIADVAKELGVRTNLCFEISDRNGIEAMRSAVKESVNFANYAKEQDDMLGAMMGLHASFTLSEETLEYCNEQKPSDIGYHVHVSEGFSDLKDSLKKYNKRVINRFYDSKILGPNSLAVHCIHINSQEMDILKETNTPVIHNPESNMGNAVGCGSIIEMYRKGLCLGMGTDGYTNDMTESYKVGNIIHKHYLCDPTVAWVEMPSMLFTNNAQIASRHMDGNVGTLEEGAYADIVVVDYKAPTPVTADNINSHILFGVSGKDVITTMINGKVLMKDRKLVNIDEESIYAKARETAEKLWININK